MQAHNFW